MENYECLILFLDNQYNQGSMKFQTARTRKTAIKKVFSNSRFQNDNILTLNLDELISEFVSSDADNIPNDATVNTYKSRIKRSIEDYIRIEKLGEKPTPSKVHDNLIDDLSVKEKITSIDAKCRLRDGEFIVDIKNIPEDLNAAELERILEVIKATLNLN